MRKFILGLAVIGFLTNASFMRAELIAPMPNIALAEAVDVEPDSELVPYEALENIRWRVRKGENLTVIAKRYAEYRGKERLQGFIDEIEKLNKAKKNPCLKSRDLILAGCVIEIPAYVAPQVRVQNIVNKAILEEWQNKAADLQSRADNRKNLVGGLLIVIVIGAVAFWILMKADATGIKKIKKLEQELAHASTNLALEQEHIRLKGLVETFSKCFPGAKYEFSDRTGAVVKDVYIVWKSHLENGRPVIDFLKCLLCEVEDIKSHNDKSHYFSIHGTSQDLKPNNWTE